MDLEGSLILREVGEGISEGESIPEDLEIGRVYQFKVDGKKRFPIGQKIPLKVASSSGGFDNRANVIIENYDHFIGRTRGNYIIVE